MNNRVPLSLVRPNPVALRTVDRETEEFAGLRDSIESFGVLSSVSVRPKKDESGDYYELVDGLQRYSASLDLGLETIPVTEALSLETDERTLAAQIAANAHRIDTKPVEFANQMKRIFAGNLTMTLNEMASLVKKSPKWVEERLGFLKLHPSIQSLVDGGQIKLSNATALTKLPHDEQLNYIEAAQVQEAGEFVPTVENRAKEIKDANRKGKNAGPAEFVAVPHLRKLSEMQAEVKTQEIGNAIVKAQKIDGPVDGFTAGVRWCLGLDTETVAAARAKFEQKAAEVKAARDKAAAERAKKKLDAANTAALVAKVAAGVASADEKKQLEEIQAAEAAAKAAKEAAKATS